jgi:hypothetical protein
MVEEPFDEREHEDENDGFGVGDQGEEAAADGESGEESRYGGVELDGVIYGPGLSLPPISWPKRKPQQDEGTAEA